MGGYPRLFGMPFAGWSRVRIAMPCWMGRVSPVFDVARRLLVVNVENSAELNREYKDMGDLGLLGRPRYVADLNVRVLICGALSVPVRLILEAKGIEVVDQICGETEEVLQAFLTGRLGDPSFLMPGSKVRREEFDLQFKDTEAGASGKTRSDEEHTILESRVDLEKILPVV